MANAEILVRDVELPPGYSGMIRHALQRIGNDWHGPVELIEITRLIDGGRSGAAVIEIALRAGGEYRRRVVKIGPAEEMAAEYDNFRRHLADYRTAVCAPIEEATPGAIKTEEQRDGEVEAVVYTHVSAYAGGRPQTPAPTLEELIDAAFREQAGVREIRQLIERLFTKMADPFHNRRRVYEKRTLRDLNPSLGPDLVLHPAMVQKEPIYGEDVLESSLGSGKFSRGTELRIAHSAGAEIRVESLDGGAALAGHVVRIRSTEQRQKLDSAFTTVDRDGVSVIADEVRTADPADGLRPALTDPRFGRFRSIVHGDLNARNVMCVEGQPILIDYAKTTDGHPLLSDAAWLEISLLRDVFAELPYPDLVRIQRFLALANRFRSVVADVIELEQVFDELLGDRALVAFRILHEVRIQAQRAFPGEDGWLDYLAQLHLAAYRTVKWDEQQPSALRAVHAAAAVATEWLAAEDPYAHWDDLPELLNRLAPIVEFSRPDAMPAMTDLLTAVDAQHPGADLPEVDELRNRFVRARYLDRARESVVELSREHETFHETVPVPLGKTTVVAGGPGSGKSRLLRELAYRGALDIARPGPETGPLRVPFLVTATDPPPELPRETLVLGGAHLLLDGLDEVPRADRHRIAAEYRALLDRHPRLRLTVVVRNGTWAASAFGSPVLELEPWDGWQITRYLSGLALSECSAGAVKDEILDLHRADGAAAPGFVTMIAEAALASEWPALGDDSYDKHFAGDLTDEELAALGSFATEIIDAGGPVRPAADLSAFVDRGILENAGDGLRFRRSAARDFFAARTLSTATDLVPQRARSFAWRDVCLLAARLPGTPGSVVDLMARSVRTADPRYAARLVSYLPTVALGYLADWNAVISDPNAGTHAHLAGAEALLLTAVPQARQALLGILLDHATPDSTRIEILQVIGAHLATHRADDTLVHWARHALGSVLAGDHTAEVRVEAIAAIETGRIRGLEVLLAELLRSTGQKVAAAADDVLRTSEVLVPPSMEEVRTALTSMRLAELEDRLPTLSGAHAIRAAYELRLELLERTGSPAELLRRRFNYGIGSAVGELLEGSGYQGLGAGAATQPADLSEQEAVASGHRILSGGLPDQDALVFAAQVDSPLHLLLIAAAAVSSPATVDHAVNLIAELAPVVTADRIEGLAALGQAVTATDRRRGFVVTRQAARVLRDRDLAARRYWPWATMLAHTRPSFAELDQLLADGVDGALEELANYAPSWDGVRPPAPRIGAAARQFLLGRSQHEEPDWALAVAAAGLTETLSRVIEIAGNRTPDTVVETVSTGRYGIVEIAPHARVLAALGGLGRLSDEPDAAHRVLDEFDTAGAHPSVELGRLAGLAHLGDGEPLLRTARGDGTPLDTAARQAIRHWIPGPCTPADLRDSGTVAALLLSLRAAPGISPERRSLLDELTHEAEQSHGNILPR
ncbi:hypothetical protein [Amycolatopsis kentuckyensis]|uniref:hypothetical protein n=1 Tax=Amycolatopsis kentuckyensis TaxID=218823 RepID=UPI003566EF0D